MLTIAMLAMLKPTFKLVKNVKIKKITLVTPKTAQVSPNAWRLIYMSVLSERNANANHLRSVYLES